MVVNVASIRNFFPGQRNFGTGQRRPEKNKMPGFCRRYVILTESQGAQVNFWPRNCIWKLSRLGGTAKYGESLYPTGKLRQRWY